MADPRPTRRDLLLIVHRLQSLVGLAKNAHGNDRNPHGWSQGQYLLEEAHRLCIGALSADPPLGKASSRRATTLIRAAMSDAPIIGLSRKDLAYECVHLVED